MCTPGFIAWHSTTYRSQVRTPGCSFLNKHKLNTSLATSTDVERLFSRGRLVLSHTRSRLSTQSTRALLCLGSWSLAKFVKDSDVAAVAVLDDVAGQIELERLAEMLSKTCRGVV